MNAGYSVREILAEAASLLGLGDKLAIDTPSDADTARFLLLLGLIERELAYRLPLVEREVVRADADGRIPKDSLSYPTVRMIAVRTGGETIPFEEDESSIRVAPFVFATVEYVPLPPTPRADGTIPFGPSECGQNVFVYGVCAAFCEAEGTDEDAERWRRKFERELYFAPKRAKSIRTREWR